MAIFHCAVKVIARSKTASTITAKAAYRSGEKIYDPTIDATYDYSRKRNIFGSEILAPENAPAWVFSRSELWVAVERKEDASTRRDTAQLARELILALPVELEHDQKQTLVRDYVQTHFVAKGMIADIAYHDFDSHNPHAHVLLSMRNISPEGFGKKNRDWNNKKLVKEWREEWARHANHLLETHGHIERIDHRSLHDRGIDREPQIHLGPIVIEMERKGVQTEMGDTYRAIAAANDNRAHQAALPCQDDVTREASVELAEDLPFPEASPQFLDEEDPDEDTLPPLPETDDAIRQQQNDRSPTNKKPGKQHSSEDERANAHIIDNTPETDERIIIRQWQQFREQQSERSKPQETSPTDQPAWEEAATWGLTDATLTVLRTWSGNQAKAERDRRIDAAMQATDSAGQGREDSALSCYLTGLGQRLKLKGKTAYKLADRWLAERLAKRGYSRHHIRRVLAEASPDVLDRQPRQRLAYVRRLVDLVMNRHEQQQRRETQQASKRTQSQRPQPRQGRGVSQAPKGRVVTKPVPTPQADNKEIARLRQQQIKRAHVALNSPDFEGYQGTALREYRKELARKIKTHGNEMTEGKLGIETDKDIAIRLYGAGFSKRDIHQALEQASPQCAGLTEAGRGHYRRQHIDPALNHPKVKQGQQEMWQWRRDRGYGYERRLEKLGLATEVPREKSQAEPKQKSPEKSKDWERER